MGYIDYSYYANEYGGKRAKGEDFTFYELSSRMIIDRYTFNRVRYALEDVPGFEIPEEIKIAQCALIDFMVGAEENGGKVIASESVSKHSVTYAGVKSYDEQAKDIVKRYLGGTPWTYAGMGAGYEM